jgi:hypothetical protein
MQFFKDCKTIEEVKHLYKKLAMQHHPDRGGDTATMQAINKVYAFACAKLAKGAGLSDEEVNQEMHMSEEYRHVVESIIYLPDITIELVGLWLWVTGNTYPIRKELKEAGLLFAPKKKAWYYRNEMYKTRSGKKTLDQIRHKYGSEMIRNQSHTQRTLTNSK